MLRVTGMSENRKDQVKAFTQRLELLLLKKGSTLSPTTLAKDFNLRWRGVPVTVNATRKWLMGQAMPTMDKIAVLAHMLNASQDWLRYGDLSPDDTDNRAYAKRWTDVENRLDDDVNSFAQDFKLLSTSNKRIVTAVIEIMLFEQRTAGPKDIPLEKNPSHF